MPNGIVINNIKTIRCVIRDCDHKICSHDVMHQRNVLVSDALDVVFAVSILQECWAFERFYSTGLRSQGLLQIITGGNSPGRPRRRDKCTCAQLSGLIQMIKDSM